jgi:hypothetical protein
MRSDIKTGRVRGVRGETDAYKGEIGGTSGGRIVDTQEGGETIIIGVKLRERFIGTQ